jgi:glucose-1-phosphate thymidylyltransferase
MLQRKGVLLAGGRGERLHPATAGINKHLLTVWDRPLLYHPLVSLMLAGVKDILLICGPEDLRQMERLFGGGRRWGLNIQYQVQLKPMGLAHGLMLAEEFLQGAPSVVALGDNIFHGHGLPELLQKAAGQEQGATVLAVRVDNPSDYGVVKLDAQGRPFDIEEKPVHPASPWAITGLYFFDQHAVEMAQHLTPSLRGELEITDLHQAYMQQGALQVIPLSGSLRWWDVGTPESLFNATSYFRDLEKDLGRKSLCPEEAAYRVGLLDSGGLERAVSMQPQGSHRRHLELFLAGIRDHSHS